METETYSVTCGVGVSRSNSVTAMVRRVTTDDHRRTHYTAFLYYSKGERAGKEKHCEHEHRTLDAAKQCARKLFSGSHQLGDPRTQCSKHGRKWNAECDECESKCPESERGPFCHRQSNRRNIVKTLSEILERDHVMIKQSSLNLPLPGLIEWFLAKYLDELSPDESTMDKVGPELAKLYL